MSNSVIEKKGTRFVPLNGTCYQTIKDAPKGISLCYIYNQPSDAPSGTSNWYTMMVIFKESALGAINFGDFALYLHYADKTYMGKVASNAIAWTALN